MILWIDRFAEHVTIAMAPESGFRDMATELPCLLLKSPDLWMSSRNELHIAAMNVVKRMRILQNPSMGTELSFKMM
ncbi:MAG: hypothetical protein NTV08_06450 [Verrucomicrobia bacterium]|nr:hypothetical protein [Verrucomicrobiota bacterium]